MASHSIQSRTLANGEKRYKATITVKGNGRIVHRFSKTHKKKPIATAYVRKEVYELNLNGVNNQIATAIVDLLDLFITKLDLRHNSACRLFELAYSSQ